jgi:hypothetical protein
MDKKKIINWLKMAMIVGGVVDLFMVIIFIIPVLRIFVFGENSQFHT